MACPNFRERTARVKLELTDFDKPSSKRCCVKGCYSTYEDVPKPSFYRFPQLNIEQRKLWIKAVGKKKIDGSNWTPLFTSRVCSVHFVTGKHNPTRGHIDYVPTIFPGSQISPKVQNLVLTLDSGINVA